MNPLAALKEKMMIKPNVEDRERVAILIKGVKPTKRKPAEKKEPSAPKLKLVGDEPVDFKLKYGSWSYTDDEFKEHYDKKLIAEDGDEYEDTTYLKCVIDIKFCYYKKNELS